MPVARDPRCPVALGVLALAVVFAVAMMLLVSRRVTAIAEVDRNYRAILEDGGKTASDNPIVRTIATFLSSHEGYLKTFAGA